MSSSQSPADASIKKQHLFFSILFVLLWSTGFIVAKIGLRYAGPFTFILIRMGIAIVIMGIFALVMKARWPRQLKTIWHLAVAGVLTHAVYLGASWSAVAQEVPVGIVAIIAGLQPLVTSVLAGPMLGEKTTQRQWIGLLVGFLCIFIIVEPRLQAAILSFQGIALAVFALLGITLGTLYQKRFCRNIDLRSGQVIQLVAASLVIWPWVYWMQERPVEWSGEFVFSLFWMSVVLSGIAITLLTWLIYNAPAASVAVLFYVTPPLAMVYAYIILGENLGWLGIAGMAVTISGLILTITKKAPTKHRHQPL